MHYLSALGVFAFLPFALSASSTPPEHITKICKQRGQVPQLTESGWNCAQTSSICDPDQDQSTLHEDSKTGNWICCPKGQELVDGSCTGGKDPVVPTPKPAPGSCGIHLKDAKFESLLRALLVQCFPHEHASLDVFIQYYITVLHEGINLIEVIYKNGCDGPDPSPGPTPSPAPVHPWWQCPADNSTPCKWLPLENNKARKSLAATSDHKVLPNPNLPVANYKYPFDTLVTKFPDDDLDIYVKDQKLQAQGSGTSYLIPAGTSGDDVYYKSPKGAQVQFYGACSKDTPCIGNELVAWQQGKLLTTADPDMELDFSGYDYDVVFTLTDTLVTTEQYVVRADGKEVGTTHGRLSLGEDKYNTKHIAKTTNVGGGAPGALKSIANDGFWGSFRIPKGTKAVTVHLDHYSPDYPYFVFEYRIDKLCQC
ncbi:hypothetical protein PENFLA_c081G00188 [Penicillium flavigenum]|uniref:Uncharacterized protein n=1 Tax=Penicillium flavigenum TaxID=254877 RepID=A0A1V6S9G8_9EURO|nr:hypothetical protein PENFLA_c081G00188 [Penicillium flavigenum]